MDTAIAAAQRTLVLAEWQQRLELLEFERFGPTVHNETERQARIAELRLELASQYVPPALTAPKLTPVRSVLRRCSFTYIRGGHPIDLCEAALLVGADDAGWTLTAEYALCPMHRHMAYRVKGAA